MKKRTSPPAGRREASVAIPAPPDEDRLLEIHRRLEGRFGPLDPPRVLDPLEELVFTVLSQNTSDLNSGRAFESLRRRYPSWERLAAADPSELASVIRAGGLANIKAPRILAILSEIQRREGGSLDLSWMKTAPADAVREYLRSLPGVGPKTAACVMAFSLELAALPVDTHVFRVAGRLGFFGPRTGASRAQDVMESVVPQPLQAPLHVGMIRLGRMICRPGRPSCEVCPLKEVCPTAPLVISTGPERRGANDASRQIAARGIAARGKAG